MDQPRHHHHDRVNDPTTEQPIPAVDGTNLMDFFDAMIRVEDSPCEQSGPRSKKVGRGKSASTVALGDAAHDVLAESPYAMTLRQLFYAFVSAGAVPKTEAGYGKLKRVMRDAREAGTVPWDWLVDHTRSVFAPRTFDGLEGLLADSAKLYRRDLMRSQTVAIQLWAESDSVGSEIAPTADRYCIPTFIGRGYSARGYLWDAARDAVAAHEAGKEVHILHVGDHDPSGVDIYRDVEETLRLYAWSYERGLAVADVRRVTTTDVVTNLTEWLVCERLALTAEQVTEYALPTRPPKTTDVRTARFTGAGAVEVEALPVDALVEIVEEAILARIDAEALKVAEVAERSEREVAKRIAATPIARLVSRRHDDPRDPGPQAAPAAGAGLREPVVRSARRGRVRPDGQPGRARSPGRSAASSVPSPG